MLYNEYGACTALGGDIAKEYRGLTRRILAKYTDISLPELLALCFDEISCTIAEEKISRATKLKRNTRKTQTRGLPES